MATILIVDDVRALAEQYAYDLKRLGGYDTLVATGGRDALEIVRSNGADCVILDLEMPGVDGFEVLRTLQAEHIETPVVVYTGTGDFARCVSAVRLGAFGFIDKSESMERVLVEVENALARARLEGEVRKLRRDLGGDSPLIGSSGPMRQLREHIARVAPIPSPVLICGESGTGKELVAREVHRLASGDPKRPFVAVNSGALPENLIESELFGHERGAFTGASRTHRGAFERAAGGTLFLDEIGELPPAAQAKLLRVLEERQISRLGAEKSIKVSARVVAATNRDLEAAVEAGRFRQDLLYRLNVHVVSVPPLRERRSDIPELVDALMATTCARFSMKEKRVSAEALQQLMNHDWSRNNVRELRNVVERMVISTEGVIVSEDDVPAEIREDGDMVVAEVGRSFKEQKTEAERRIVLAALKRNDGQIGATAEELGLADHSSLLKIMRRLGLQRS